MSIDRMKSLMNYGSNETNKMNESKSVLAEDGFEYKIVREGLEYFIKKAEAGSDNFDYVDGLRHKRNYVFGMPLWHRYCRLDDNDMSGWNFWCFPCTYRSVLPLLYSFVTPL